MNTSKRKTIEIPARITEAIKRKMRPKSALETLKKRPRAVEARQIWTSPMPPLESGSYCLLVMETLSDGILNACPVFIWTEYAGPMDIVLPNHYGIRLAVSFELESTFASESLSKSNCAGRLSDDAFSYILDAARRIRGVDKAGLVSGPEYIDENDIRHVYHENILEQIEELQAEVVKKVYAKEMENLIDYVVNPFERIAPSLMVAEGRGDYSEYALAAKSAEKSRRQSFGLPSFKGLEIVFTEDADKSFVHINVFRKGTPDKSLDGARILDTSDGSVLATLKNARAKIPADKIRENICLTNAEGSPLKLRRKVNIH